MMTRYEILMLTVPEITEDESKGIEQNVRKLIKDVKGEVISFERWGKYRLAYQVKKHDYGIYFLTRFEVEKSPALFKEIQSLFTLKYNEIVMRNVVVKLDAKQTLEYKRPHSVEDAPVRDVDSFLRDNKMDGLMSDGFSDRSDRRDRDFDRSDRRDGFSDRPERRSFDRPERREDSSSRERVNVKELTKEDK